MSAQPPAATDAPALRLQVQALQRALAQAQARLQAVADASGEVLGTLHWQLQADGVLTLLRANAVAARMIQSRFRTPAWVRRLAMCFRASIEQDIHQTLVHVWRQKAASWSPTGLLGEGHAVGSGLSCAGLPVGPANVVVVKFWDRSDSGESAVLRMRAQQQMSAIFAHSPTAHFPEPHRRWCFRRCQCALVRDDRVCTQWARCWDARPSTLDFWRDAAKRAQRLAANPRCRCRWHAAPARKTFPAPRWAARCCCTTARCA